MGRESRLAFRNILGCGGVAADINGEVCCGVWGEDCVRVLIVFRCAVPILYPCSLSFPFPFSFLFALVNLHLLHSCRHLLALVVAFDCTPVAGMGELKVEAAEEKVRSSLNVEYFDCAGALASRFASTLKAVARSQVPLFEVTRFWYPTSSFDDGRMYLAAA